MIAQEVLAALPAFGERLLRGDALSNADDDYVDFDPEALGSDLCTVARAANGHARFIRQRAGDSKFAEIKVIVVPYSGSRCYRFRWKASPSALPKTLMKDASFRGIKEALLRPLSGGRQIAFVEVSVVDGSYHDQDTDEQATAIAASMAVQDALSRATLVDV